MMHEYIVCTAVGEKACLQTNSEEIKPVALSIDELSLAGDIS